MPASRPTPFRFPAIRPVIPPISAWAHYLEPSYEAKWFSNFGPVVRQFEEALTARLCHSNEIITSANNCTSGIAAPLFRPRARLNSLKMRQKESLRIRRGYFPSLEDWPGTRKLAGCPIACSLAERMVSLPVYSDCTDDEIASIIGIVRRALDAALNVKSHANV